MNNSDIKKVLSANIKKYRKEKSLSQFELGEKAEISDQTVNSIEGCRLWPSDKSLSKIAKALDIDIYKLFIPEEIDISPEIENELKVVVKKSINNIVNGLLKEI